MKLTVLGCLGAYPYKGEGTSSYLLESEGFHLLIDAGSTTLVRLENYLDPCCYSLNPTSSQCFSVANYWNGRCSNSGRCLGNVHGRC